jgi:hypothetical protein
MVMVRSGAVSMAANGATSYLTLRLGSDSEHESRMAARSILK